MERHIIFVTSNANKITEVYPHFERYGIKLHQHSNQYDTDETIIQCALSNSPSMNIFAIISEQTRLYQKGTENLALMTHFEPVDHVSILNISMVKNGIVTEKLKYQYTTSGTIIRNLNKHMHMNVNTVFGWDDIFYLDSCQRNYHQLRKDGIKISSRDMVISEFLKEKVYYKKLIDLKHHPQNLDQSVSFETEGLAKVYMDVMEKNQAIAMYGIDKIIKYVFEEGIYVSSPMNRRIKLNWNPGLNPIPLVRKEKDPLHEITYGVHDMGHFSIKPDLIFTGCHPNSEIELLNKRLYLVNRMMSEAITLPFADMFFVKSVLDSGNDYATRVERKIYPLFEKIMHYNPLQLNCDPEDNKQMLDLLLPYYKAILRANVHYCILGDKSKFVALLNGNVEKEFVDYDKKYSQFFIQDFRWTNVNYKQMVKDSKYHEKWWSIVSVINDKFSLGLTNINTFRDCLTKFKLHRLTDSELVDTVFEFVFSNNVVPVFTRKYQCSLSNNLTKAFVRYLCNQMFIFIKYSHVPYADYYINSILGLVEDIYQRNVNTTKELISNIRSFIKTFLDKCVDANAMTIDDATTFEQLYSIVDPFIVDYDKEYKWPLNLVANKILSGDDSDI